MPRHPDRQEQGGPARHPDVGKGVFAFDGRHQTFAPYTRDDEKGRKEKTDGEAPGQMALEEVPEDKNAPF